MRLRKSAARGIRTHARLRLSARLRAFGALPLDHSRGCGFKGVYIAVMCGRTLPGRHAEGKCIKNFIKIDYFSSKSQAISIKFLIQKNQHAEGKSNKNHPKIDGFSSKFNVGGF